MSNKSLSYKYFIWKCKIYACFYLYYTNNKSSQDEHYSKESGEKKVEMINTFH